jgi:hypothetical protein
MKLRCLLFALAVYLPALLSAQTITLFDGTGGFIVEDWTSFEYDYVDGKLRVEGDGTDQLSVTFDPVEIADPNQIYLTATLNTEEGVYSQVWFYNTDFTRIMIFDGWIENSGVSNTILLTYVDDEEVDNDFFNDIAAADFFMGGFLSPLGITFESLTAIPEPGTYALVVSGLLASVLFFRRRHRHAVQV